MPVFNLNDPDFDTPAPTTNISPRMMFLGGMVLGVMVLCTIGFIVLLSVVLSRRG